jgi:hypothetical protein
LGMGQRMYFSEAEAVFWCVFSVQYADLIHPVHLSFRILSTNEPILMMISGVIASFHPHFPAAASRGSTSKSSRSQIRSKRTSAGGHCDADESFVTWPLKSSHGSLKESTSFPKKACEIRSGDSPPLSAWRGRRQALQWGPAEENRKRS